MSRLSWKIKRSLFVKQDMHSKLGLQLARSRISECFSLEHFLWTFCWQLEHLIPILLFYLSRWNNVFKVFMVWRVFHYFAFFHFIVIIIYFANENACSNQPRVCVQTWTCTYFCLTRDTITCDRLLMSDTITCDRLLMSECELIRKMKVEEEL